MKTLSPALEAHLAGELATLATLIKISRRDNMVLGFTSHDQDLAVDGVTYKADSAFEASALEARQGLSTDNLEIAGILDGSALDGDAVRRGLYDHARIDVYLCNWADLSQGVMQLRRGWLGEVTLKGSEYQAEVRGLHDLLQRPIGASFTPECRHQLGDNRCTVNLAGYTVSGSATSVLDAARFYDSSRSEADGYFDSGLVTWTSGPNAGLSMEVKRFADKLFTLWLPMPQAITAGHAFTAIAGCDKRYATCRTKFSNLVNFGGFPHLPGVDRILNYPDARA
jgi:uncharacterized phage protein (TIGR02218 family)